MTLPAMHPLDRTGPPMTAALGAFLDAVGDKLDLAISLEKVASTIADENPELARLIFALGGELVVRAEDEEAVLRALEHGLLDEDGQDTPDVPT